MTEQTSSITMQEQRVIRVFVSSTFRDMHAERDELILRIFPQLRKLCGSRGVTWSEVDLRWGITEEQSQRGEVLPICLAEIQRCRPYFIGLLGERYGWVPDEIPQELIDQHDWLKKHLHHSVTELEILHGVLNDPAMANHALFYFRDPAYLNSVAPEQRADYQELPTKEEIARYGQPEAERRAAERREKLATLKAHIKAGPFPVVENYANPQALGERVLRDLTEIIDRLYPQGSEPALLDREAMEHEAFAQSRARVYIGRQSYYDRLDEHARSDGTPLVVLGESGAGKSALLSNWALRYRAAHPEELLLLHFIGATPYSADWAAMLRRVMGEFKRRFDIQQEIPDKPDELRAAFANWLHMAAARGKVVLILDALNQLEDRDGAPDLVWLPPGIPANIRLIVSTLPGRALDDLTRRGWPTMQIEPLEASERKQLIEDYLGQHAKQLSPARVERIASAAQAANPLYLRALLDELRVFGIYEKLDARIEHYLTATSVDKLYEKILERYEQDYERERPGLVREAMSLLWAARRGLSEAELLALLGEDNKPLPRAHWSPLYLAAEQPMVSRAGLIGFGHEYLHRAVQHRYLRVAEQQAEIHLRLADYFEKRELGARKIDELPWQLTQAGEWKKLYALLANEEFFIAAWEADNDLNQFEVKKFWAQVESASPYRMIEAYKPIITNPALTRNRNAIYQIARLFADSGRVHEALPLIYYLVDECRASIGTEERTHLLWTLASFLLDAGEVDAAFPLNIQLRKAWRDLGNKRGEAAALTNQAVIFRDRGDLHRALRLLEVATELHHASNSKVELANCLGKRAEIHFLLQEYYRANQLLDEKGIIEKTVGNQAGLAHCLNSRGVICLAQDRLDDALQLHQEEEQLCRSQGDRVGLQRALGSQAVVKTMQGRLEEALSLADAAMAVCVEIKNKEGLACCHGVRGRILRRLGRYEEARKDQETEESLARELGNVIQIATSLAEQALTAQAIGHIKKAEELWNRSRQLLSATDLRSRIKGTPQGE